MEELPRKKKKTKKTPSTSRHTRKIEGARFKAILKKRLDRNREIASSRFNEVLLARLLIFAQFITAVTEAGKDIQSMKQVWLLLQLFPAKIRPDGNVASQDIFTQLALQLSRASPSDVHGTITWILEWCRRKIGVTTSNSFFCVVDEAPFASSKYNKAFRSASGTLPRPVLRELMFAWANYNVSNVTLRFILTGTGINADIVDEAIRSAIGKMAPVHRIRATGAFDENTQRAYLEYYCPQIFMDPHSTSLAVELLRKRMWYWLRGRYVAPLPVTPESLLIYNGTGIVSLPHSLKCCLRMGWNGPISFSANSLGSSLGPSPYKPLLRYPRRQDLSSRTLNVSLKKRSACGPSSR